MAEILSRLAVDDKRFRSALRRCDAGKGSGNLKLKNEVERICAENSCHGLVGEIIYGFGRTTCHEYINNDSKPLRITEVPVYLLQALERLTGLDASKNHELYLHRFTNFEIGLSINNTPWNEAVADGRDVTILNNLYFQLGNVDDVVTVENEDNEVIESVRLGISQVRLTVDEHMEGDTSTAVIFNSNSENNLMPGETPPPEQSGDTTLYRSSSLNMILKDKNRPSWLIESKDFPSTIDGRIDAEELCKIEYASDSKISLAVSCAEYSIKVVRILGDTYSTPGSLEADLAKRMSKILIKRSIPGIRDEYTIQRYNIMDGKLNADKS